MYIIIINLTAPNQPQGWSSQPDPTKPTTGLEFSTWPHQTNHSIGVHNLTAPNQSQGWISQSDCTKPIRGWISQSDCTKPITGLDFTIWLHQTNHRVGFHNLIAPNQSHGWISQSNCTKLIRRLDFTIWLHQTNHGVGVHSLTASNKPTFTLNRLLPYWTLWNKMNVQAWIPVSAGRNVHARIPVSAGWDCLWAVPVSQLAVCCPCFSCRLCRAYCPPAALNTAAVAWHNCLFLIKLHSLVYQQLSLL